MRTSILSDRLFSRHGTLASHIRRAAFALAVAAALAIPFVPAAAPAHAAAHAAIHQIAVTRYLDCPATGSSC